MRPPRKSGPSKPGKNPAGKRRVTGGSKAPFPSREDILTFIQDQGGHVGKREIARAFNLDAEQKVMLKVVLKGMADEGAIDKGRGKRFAEPGTLPAVTILVITGIDDEGDAKARPANWNEAEWGAPPAIRVTAAKREAGAVGIGDRVLAHLDRRGNGYTAKVIRRLASAPATTLGIYRAGEKPLRGRAGAGRLLPTDKRAKQELIIEPEDAGEASDGDLVRCEVLSQKRLGLRRARVIEVIDGLDDPRSISLVALHEHGVPMDFPDEVIAEAEAKGAAKLGERTDLRALPLVTIDGEDARDFDDAVFAEADDDPGNPGGHHLIVAIADVSWYVRPGSELDKEAYKRGNSTYLPDRVVPMLPEALSNGWCSLVPNEDRPCLAAHLWIDSEGNMRRHKIVRGLMRSAHRYTYNRVQNCADGDGTAADPALVKPLYAAYEALWKAREKRGVLDLDLPERRVLIAEDGTVADIVTRERFDAHKLIEEFMILANVAAAETLEKKRQPCMYRVHDEPSLEKQEALRTVLASVGITMARAQAMRPAVFNRILERAKGGPHQAMVNELVLRTQAQAVYSPENLGHFGLALTRYCHFTSPIRRYSDLLVHRALVTGLKLGEGGLPAEPGDFALMGEHISMTERRSATAERDAIDRFTARHLADKVGTTLKGRITGVQKFGFFVRLDNSGGDGLVPVSSLADDYYAFDEAHHLLIGQSTGREYRLGDEVEVLLVEANPLSGGLVLQVMAAGGKPVGKGARWGAKAGRRDGRRPGGSGRGRGRR
ncbi:MAG: ribonuclease R [Rhodospirillales bacterium]